MPDVLGWRKKFGVLLPSSNTIVEPDFYAMSVPGVTAHGCRIWIDEEPPQDPNEPRHTHVTETVPAVQRLLTSRPDYLIMGISGPTFRGGVEGNREWKIRMKEYSGGLDIANNAEACERALRGLNVRRIGVLTPYQASGSVDVLRYFEEAGFDVVSHQDLGCAKPIDIAQVGEEVSRKALLEINNDDVQAIVQAGTNLNFLRLAAEAERWLGKPVLASNAVTWWMALRDNDIQDKIYGFGQVLSQF
ncbi:MAG: arylmalonate decarboxylase [Dehalococcoidia bacterium]